MAETTIGNLTLGAVDGTTLFEQERTVSGSQVSEKVTSSSVANFVGTSAQFAGLSTTAKNLVGAINEAAQSGGGASVIQLTQAEYTALSTAEKMNGSIYKLTDKAIFYCLDEEYHAVKELTTAQYEALTSAEQNNGTIYIKTDAETTGEDIPVNTLTPDTSINSAINACFGRTASDIPYSQGVSVADKLNTIPNISISSNHNNDVLRYNSSSQMYVNTPLGFKVQEFTKSYTVNANSALSFSNNFITVPTGYKMLAILGYTTNDVQINLTSCKPWDSGAYAFQLYNTRNTSVTNTFVVRVAFVAENWL